MTARGMARLAGYLAATTAVGLALLVRDTLRDITAACRLPAEFRHTNVDDLLASYEAHAWPYENTAERDNLGWSTSR